MRKPRFRRAAQAKFRSLELYFVRLRASHYSQGNKVSPRDEVLGGHPEVKKFNLKSE